MAAAESSLLAALADEPRLRVFAVVLLDRPTTAEASARSGLREKEVLRALTRLEAAGLVSRDGPSWRAHPEILRDAVVTSTPPPEFVDHGAPDAETATVLRTFMPQGRLEQIPMVRSKRLVVLDHICRVFEPGQRYSEREVSVLLEAFHADYAALRRYLVDEGFLTRQGGTYWRSGGTFEL